MGRCSPSCAITAPHGTRDRARGQWSPGAAAARGRQAVRLNPGRPQPADHAARLPGRSAADRPSSWITGAYAYAATEDWLPGGFGELDEVESATELARRWLRRFGPGTMRDLQWWMGWTLGLTRRALEGAGAVPVALTDGPGWVTADDEPVEETEPWVALLPALDPSTMGWKERTWYLPHVAADAFDSVGNGGPTIWVNGRIVGAWAPGQAGCGPPALLRAGRRRTPSRGRRPRRRPQIDGRRHPLHRPLPA